MNSRYAELYQRELSHRLKKEFVQRGTERYVARLHGHAQGQVAGIDPTRLVPQFLLPLSWRVYTRVDVTGTGTYIRVLPKSCGDIPRGQGVVWANVYWVQSKQWEVMIIKDGVHKYYHYDYLNVALQNARQMVGRGVPNLSRPDLSPIKRKFSPLSSVYPTREQMKRDAQLSADYWLDEERSLEEEFSL